MTRYLNTIPREIPVLQYRKVMLCTYRLYWYTTLESDWKIHIENWIIYKIWSKNFSETISFSKLTFWKSVPNNAQFNHAIWTHRYVIVRSFVSWLNFFPAEDRIKNKNTNIVMFLSPTNALLYYTYKMLKYTVKISHDCSYMFRSIWTIIREPIPNLAKVTILCRYSVKMRR